MKGSKNLIVGERIARSSLLTLVGLTIVKAFAAYFTGMVVLVADMLSSITDIISLFASYIGLKLSRKTADNKFEYGYYKVETFGSLLVSLLIVYFGYKVFGDAAESFWAAPTGLFHAVGFATTFISIIFSVRLARKLADAARRTNSISLMNNAIDKKLDIVASFAVLASILSNMYSIQYVESVISMVMAVMIIKVGIDSTKESLFYLLDYWDNPKLLRKIKKIILKNTEIVLKIKKIRMRRAGTFIFGEAFIEVNPFADMVDLREEIDLMTKQIQEANPYIKDFTIFTHLTKFKRIRIAMPVQEGYGLKAKLAKSLKKTVAYEFVDIKGQKVSKKYRKRIKAPSKDAKDLINFLKKEKINVVIDNGLNSLVYYNLRRYSHIQVYPNFSNIKTVGDAVKLLTIDL